MSAKCPWRQRTSGAILPLLPLIYYRLTAPKVGHKVDARTLEAIGNADGKLTHDVRYFSSFWFEILMFYIHIYIYTIYSVFLFAGLTLCYQRQSVSSNNNHNNADAKPTHLPPLHYPHGHKWNEPYFDLTMPRNITSLVGKSAYLGCRVKHLGNKTVSSRTEAVDTG